jgi:hypothetical protein
MVLPFVASHENPITRTVNRRLRMAVEEKDFLLKDYELKVRYLSDHFQRMWTRFNFFVTIESALIGGKFLIASNTPSRELAIAGIILSGLWYLMGAQDRYLVKLYRWELDESGKRIAETVWNAEAAKGYDPVGRVDDDIVACFRAHEQAELANKGGLQRLLIFILEGISSWRSKRFSITHLAAFYPLIAVGLWILMFVFSKPLP